MIIAMSETVKHTIDYYKIRQEAITLGKHSPEEEPSTIMSLGYCEPAGGNNKPHGSLSNYYHRERYYLTIPSAIRVMAGKA